MVFIKLSNNYNRMAERRRAAVAGGGGGRARSGNAVRVMRRRRGRGQGEGGGIAWRGAVALHAGTRCAPTSVLSYAHGLGLNGLSLTITCTS